MERYQQYGGYTLDTINNHWQYTMEENHPYSYISSEFKLSDRESIKAGDLVCINSEGLVVPAKSLDQAIGHVTEVRQECLLGQERTLVAVTWKNIDPNWWNNYYTTTGTPTQENITYEYEAGYPEEEVPKLNPKLKKKKVKEVKVSTKTIAEEIDEKIARLSKPRRIRALE